MFPSVTRTFRFLASTPLIPQSTGPASIELSSFAAGPSRPRAASRTFSNMSLKSTYGYSVQSRGYASAPGKKELYSDEAGATGAGTDDVAHTDAAFDSNPDPKSAAKDVEKESGKNFTSNSPANPADSKPPGKAGETNKPLNSSKFDEKK